MGKRLLRLCVCVLLTACSSTGGGDKDVVPADTGPLDDAVVPEDLVDDLWPQPVDVVPDGSDSATPEDVPETDLAPPDGDVEPVVDFGFDIREPQSYQVTCSEYPEWMPADPINAGDADWLCTFDRDGVSGVIYVQATATDCVVYMVPLPTYETSAWISVDGEVEALTDVYYDYGGNHQNDYFEFTFGGEHFKYYHSTFGIGYRACQPMDCMNVLDNGGTILEEGCTPDRTLPVVCVPVKADGSYDELLDDFEKCAGDDA